MNTMTPEQIADELKRRDADIEAANAVGDTQAEMRHRFELSCFIRQHADALPALLDAADELEQVKAERDRAVAEASRRDQKWMEGINECVGEKLDYDALGGNALRTLDQWAAEVRAERDAATARAEKAKEDAADEKNRRVKYQDLAYDYCRTIDQAWGYSIRNGTGTTIEDAKQRGTALLQQMQAMREYLKDLVLHGQIDKDEAAPYIDPDAAG